jgi:hypothetical protein
MYHGRQLGIDDVMSLSKASHMIVLSIGEPFIIVAGETSHLIIPYMKSLSTHDLALERGYCLSTKMIRVFGTEYIHGLVIDKYPKGASIPWKCDRTKIRSKHW